MRLGGDRRDGFVGELDSLTSVIQERFVARMQECTRSVPLKVMLGDATVTEQMTFDPALVRDYFGRILGRLDGWTVQDLTVTNNEDLRRIFTKFEARAGSYLLSGHLSIQFHVLLYYRPDQRVIDAQRELSEIIDTTKEKESLLADEGDRLVMDKLRESGYADLDHGDLFRVLFEDDQLREKIHDGIHQSTDEEFQRLSKKKLELFGELDGLLVETYQTSSVLIDDARLVTGEEGYLCTLDLEFVKNNSREGLFDPGKISAKTRQEIVDRLAGLADLVQE